jgi:hypothetical protein
MPPEISRHTGADSIIVSRTVSDDLFVLRQQLLVAVCKFFGFDPDGTGDLPTHFGP